MAGGNGTERAEDAIDGQGREPKVAARKLGESVREELR
jgi:hypothetical protein